MRFHYSVEKLTCTVDVDADFVEAILCLVRENAIQEAVSAEAKKTFVKVVKHAASQAEGFPQPASPDSPEPEQPSEEERSAAEEKKAKAYVSWYRFVRMWLINFDQAGEQPERGEQTRRLAHSRRAGAVCKLVRELGGMTHAVFDVVTVLHKDGDSARLDGMTDEELQAISRAVAENITQVSSILFSDLSDLLEYHNPFEDEDL